MTREQDAVGLAQKLYTVAFVASIPFVVAGALFAANELGYSRGLAFIIAFNAPFAWLVVSRLGYEVVGRAA